MVVSSLQIVCNYTKKRSESTSTKGNMMKAIRNGKQIGTFNNLTSIFSIPRCFVIEFAEVHVH